MKNIDRCRRKGAVFQHGVEILSDRGELQKRGKKGKVGGEGQNEETRTPGPQLELLCRPPLRSNYEC